jgi:hypothetical protein
MIAMRRPQVDNAAVTRTDPATDRDSRDNDGTDTDVGRCPGGPHRERIRHGTGRIVAAIAYFIERVCGIEIF